jgi:hypothetical protein
MGIVFYGFWGQPRGCKISGFYYSNGCPINKNRPPIPDTFFRRSGRECRNPEARDGSLRNLPPCNLDAGTPCRHDAVREVKGIIMISILAVAVSNHGK